MAVKHIKCHEQISNRFCNAAHGQRNSIVVDFNEKLVRSYNQQSWLDHTSGFSFVNGLQYVVVSL